MATVPPVVTEQFLSLFIEIFASLISLATNGFALLIVCRVKRLRNSFGMLCTFLVVANILVISIKIIWIFHPESRIPHQHSAKAKVFGDITLFLWFFAMKTHVAISIDRFLNFVYPSKDENPARTKTYGFILFMTAAVQTSLLHIYPGAFFAHDIVDHSWNYRGSEWANIYAIYFDFYSCTSEMLFIFVIDCITLSKLTKFARKNSDIDDKRKKNERRLLVQSILQSVPYMFLLFVYFEVTSRMESPFGIFIATTLGWQGCTAMDGLFIILFHAKKLFKRRQQ